MHKNIFYFADGSGRDVCISRDPGVCSGRHGAVGNHIAYNGNHPMGLGTKKIDLSRTFLATAMRKEEGPKPMEEKDVTNHYHMTGTLDSNTNRFDQMRLQTKPPSRADDMRKSLTNTIKPHTTGSGRESPAVFDGTMDTTLSAAGQHGSTFTLVPTRSIG
mmetsp:Transcript_11196/g.18282  ORF Transcript_11196/g.18282 Transcript_11196/m.18282 type:complete len:160 (+) Transcript_11196:96-575(+)|eukprot:CAMPEP_0184646706 /NCGR_PEP_ID=MMETSP0308-20130426/3455_1 /TAXON_ID=38269 /ORGANISM="Gloeochaete witrockiana, Strain SAG 46.84" /LENGTH=159 /DNA_ID=CAMNT_0027076979 /DNA_START=96 /DNA_END=575 /DNA_ORIENTATION=-